MTPFDIINELKEYGVEVIIFDPMADGEEVKHEYGVELTKYDKNIKADAVIVAVNHDAIKKALTLDALKNHTNSNGCKGVVIDVKGIFNPGLFNGSGLLYWRL